MPFPERVKLAAGALKNMGLTSNLSRLVLLCGHGSKTTNNPYGSGLDCGACGGNTGEANSRIAAQVLNDIEVRSSLSSMGIEIPKDTWFLAGLHNTTTDEVLIYDEELLPKSHVEDLNLLLGLLKTASEKTRQERLRKMVPRELKHIQNIQESKIRSQDWSEVRPEWGLAGNAAFIIAKRDLTHGLNLEGRTFLHNYDSAKDADGKVLELIMTAPMIVTNWINLQYYASTVNNDSYGSGNKIIHNIVGNLGALQGNGSDLLVGLPFQSVHDGKKLVHEPLRLQVIIEAPLEKIDSIIAKHENVRQLANNSWLSIIACISEEQEFYLYQTGNWNKVPNLKK
jgi:uncharacterized protein YbcC (UPF0753/DUF2309 family)